MINIKMFYGYIYNRGLRKEIEAISSLAEDDKPASPLVVYGKSGVGKTFLMDGLKAKLRAMKKSALYITAETLMSEYTEALSVSSDVRFGEKHREYDALLIDGAEYFAGKYGCIERFSEFVREMAEEGKRVMVAVSVSGDYGVEFAKGLASSCGAECIYIPLPGFDVKKLNAQHLSGSFDISLSDECASELADKCETVPEILGELAALAHKKHCEVDARRLAASPKRSYLLQLMLDGVGTWSNHGPAEYFWIWLSNRMDAAVLQGISEISDEILGVKRLLLDRGVRCRAEFFCFRVTIRSIEEKPDYAESKDNFERCLAIAERACGDGEILTVTALAEALLDNPTELLSRIIDELGSEEETVCYSDDLPF